MNQRPPAWNDFRIREDAHFNPFLDGLKNVKALFGHMVEVDLETIVHPSS